jgi:hypothetical protein
VDIVQIETNLCWHTTNAVLNLTTNSYWAPEYGGTVKWTTVPAGLSIIGTPTGGTFTFNPSNSPPASYVVTARSSLLTNCYDTCTVRVLKVDFLDASKNETTSLKVGKWENSFNTGPTVKDEFIAPDDDKFYVRVNDQSKKGTGKVSVKLSTDSAGTDYDDDATEIELPEEPANSGIFISTNMLMVSDNVADDTKNDRTHKIALGGKVKVQYPETGTVICEKEANVPPSLKTVDVNIIILRDKPLADGGTPVIAVSAVNTDWKLVRERYAQVGVTVNWSGPTIADPPSGVDLTDGFKIRDPMSANVLTAEARSLIAGLGTTNTTADIHVFYINSIQGALGTAVADYWYAPSEDSYLYNVVLGADRGLFDPAHELGHLLTDAGYGTGVAQVNLMYEATYTTNSVTTMKRINLDQETKIRGNAHVY